MSRGWYRATWAVFLVLLWSLAAALNTILARFAGFNGWLLAPADVGFGMILTGILSTPQQIRQAVEDKVRPRTEAGGARPGPDPEEGASPI